MGSLCNSISIFFYFLGNLIALFTRCSSNKAKYEPLKGVKVLDLTRILAGPHCTMNLGDLGADIIKVERPGTGDDTRIWHPPRVGDESVYFMSINRNKQSIAVNMKSKEGKDIIEQLSEKCDVLVENYLPGKLETMGLGYDDLRATNPGLIYVSITGFGQTGPYSQRAGYDVVAAAIGGLMHITGPEDGEPCRVGVAMTDLATGLYAGMALTAALLQREKTGLGQHIDCNLLNTQVAILSHIAANYLISGQEARRFGTGHTSVVPYQAFKTKDDKYMIVGGGNNHLFADMCKIMDLEEIATDARYRENDDRVRNRKQLIQTISNRFSQHTLAEWLIQFEGSSCPYGPINNMEEVFSDPQVLHNEMIQEIDHPTVGKIRIPGPPVRYRGAETTLTYPPPTLGQHTDSILKELLNYSQDSIANLRENGVIQ